MKLYFYILEEPYNGKPFIQFEECEADEKPKTYWLHVRPIGFYWKKISKENIGKRIENAVILLEKDDFLARSIFAESINKKISDEEKQVKWLREQLEVVEKGEIQ
jgi:hypothetical protein